MNYTFTMPTNNKKYQIKKMDKEDETYCKYVGSSGIRKICDMTSLDNSTELYDYDFTKLKEKDILYIKTDKIINFCNIMYSLPCKVVLVVGSSDYTMPTDLFENIEHFSYFINCPNIIHFFMENLVISHPKITHLPIGLDYHTLSKGSMEWGQQITPLQQENMIENINRTSLPFWEREIKAYSNFHFRMDTKYAGDRLEAINEVPRELVYYEPVFVGRIDTWNKQRTFAFVLSPHGNGLDCHRTWEALVLGCIPIVKTSPIDPLYTDLPVLIVENWRDVTAELLEKTVNEFKTREFKMEKLTLKYWNDKFREMALQ